MVSTFSEIPVNGYLKHFINAFWEYECLEDASFDILPDGLFDLILNIHQGNIQEVNLTGVWTKALRVDISEGSHLYGIQFRLLAVEYFLQSSIESILNTKTALPLDFMGLNQINPSSLQSFADTFAAQALKGIKGIKEIDMRKLDLFDRLYACQGKTSVGSIAKEVNWSSRQINRYFNKSFGFPLKTFLDILKCHQSYEQIAKGELYPNEAYFDQAHFIRHVKRYTGTTPKKLHENKNDRFIQLSTLKKK